jgi:hypothetical protein
MVFSCFKFQIKMDLTKGIAALIRAKKQPEADWILKIIAFDHVGSNYILKLQDSDGANIKVCYQGNHTIEAGRVIVIKEVEFKQFVWLLRIDFLDKNVEEARDREASRARSSIGISAYAPGDKVPLNATVSREVVNLAKSATHSAFYRHGLLSGPSSAKKARLDVTPVRNESKKNHSLFYLKNLTIYFSQFVDSLLLARLSSIDS